MRLLTLFGLIATALVGWTGTANAYPICEYVYTNGTVIGYHDIVDQCFSYSGPNICHREDAGLDPSAHVYTQVCVPAP